MESSKENEGVREIDVSLTNAKDNVEIETA